MSQLRQILNDLQDTDLTLERLLTLAHAEASDEITLFNAETIRKRRQDLERKLSYALHHEQADVVEYKIERVEVNNYPAKAIASSILTFQELLTSVFDAIRTTPKRIYRPSPDSIELSAMEFAGARAGSVVVSLSVYNERLIAIKSYLDDTFGLVFAILHATSDRELREIVNRVGISSISKAYSWAENCAAYGLDTSIVWSKGADVDERIAISRDQAATLKDAIDATSDEKVEQVEYECELIGIDDSTSYFHIKTNDEVEIKGGLSDEFPKGLQSTIHVRYRASLSRSIKTKYSTGEEREQWSLHRMIAI